MRKNKNTSKIILALIVAGLATMITYSVLSSQQKELEGKEKLIELMQNTKAQNTNIGDYAYAVATKDLKSGELVADGDVDFKQFTQSDATAFENRSDVINKVLLQDIPSGAAFTTVHIAKVSGDNVSLRTGYRSLTLPASNFQGKSSKMTVGSNVDIFSSSKENGWALDNVKIMSFEGSAGSKEVPTISNATSINFEVPVESIGDFISNVSKGGLVLVARNPKDKKVTRIKQHGYTPSNFGGNSINSLPSLPSSVPISNLPEGNLPGGDVSGLPMPIKPAVQVQEVEMIEANVKSKVTFD